MGNFWFDFQQFRILQDRCAMKISTDAVLLGALAQAENPAKILDIGTGTGVIALMLAQRFPQSTITAVELDEEAASQASENFKNSPFATRLEIFQGRVQDFSGGPFELIVSNPPYFQDHLKSSDPRRLKALHTDELSFEDLAAKIQELLQPKGSFCVILPPRQMEELTKILEGQRIFESQRIQVRDRAESRILRCVSFFSFQEQELLLSELVLKSPDGTYTTEYQSLIAGFLLGY